MRWRPDSRRHFSLQYATASQFLAHFLRHSKGRLHTGQSLVGSWPFFLFILASLLGLLQK
jgi:hypothetical protein